MKAKEYLAQIKDMDTYIQCKQLELDYWRDLTRRVQAVRYDSVSVRGTGGNTTENLILKIVMLEQKVDQMIDCYVDTRWKILQQLDGMKTTHPLYYRILHLRYVMDMSLKDIAVKENISYDRVRHIHGYALLEFEHRYLSEKK